MLILSQQMQSTSLCATLEELHRDSNAGETDCERRGGSTGESASQGTHGTCRQGIGPSLICNGDIDWLGISQGSPSWSARFKALLDGDART